MIRRTLIAMSIVVVSGCQLTETNHDADTSARGEEITFRPLGEFDVAGAESVQGDTPEARAARLELLGRVMDRVKAVRHVLSSAASVDQKRRDLKRVWLDARLPETEAWFVDQLAASIVLEDSQLGSSLEPADELVIATIERLIARRSPNAALLAKALASAEGGLPDARLISLSEQAAGFATHWIEETCAECDRKAEAHGEGVRKLRPDVHRIQIGVDELRALADRLRKKTA